MRISSSRAAVLWALAVLAGCDDAPEADGDGPADAGLPADAVAFDACVPVAAPTACPDPPVRYGDVRPIIDARCMGCHYGQEGGPWPLTTYSHVADWQDFIRASLLDCTMPPQDAGVGMTAAERTTVLTWIRCGSPE
jgi:hypothetical protein